MSETFDIEASRKLINAPVYGDIEQLVTELQEALAAACDEVERLDDLYDSQTAALGAAIQNAQEWTAAANRLTARVERLEKALWSTIAELEFASEAQYEGGSKQLAETFYRTAKRARAALRQARGEERS